VSALRPRNHLETHDVANQPPPFEDVNLFTSDVARQAAVAAAGGEAHADRISAFDARTGSTETAEWATQANGNPPQLKAFDRYGRRTDEVEFHPAYHWLMALGLEAGISSAAWSGIAAGHVLHAALEFLMAQAEPSVCCPMTMTHAAPAALKCQPNVAAAWTPKIAASQYDPSSQPIQAKSGVTIGMAMTEKQGGSDVRANTTRAVERADGGYALTGHCSLANGVRSLRQRASDSCQSAFGSTSLAGPRKTFSLTSEPAPRPGQRVEVNIAAAREFAAGIEDPRRRAFAVF
jgi:putative acyl-CoA dehydrogenase